MKGIDRFGQVGRGVGQAWVGEVEGALDVVLFYLFFIGVEVVNAESTKLYPWVQVSNGEERAAKHVSIRISKLLGNGSCNLAETATRDIVSGGSRRES
jgi:hypothetical protein